MIWPSPPSKFFYNKTTKNFGVGIEPTRTSKAGGAPFAFPLLDLILIMLSMKYNTLIFEKKILLFCRISKKSYLS
ncbi:hypothetical protein WQ54_27580 [Bacillus sp. SA1-12]|nr:hypothetical protein WQ54_27580 [Bacillus sp. SA1-12]